MPEDKDDPWGLKDTGVAKSRLRAQKPPARFDPYQGVMSVKQPSRKKDLRKVEEWLKAKRRAKELKRENEGNGQG